MIDKKQLMEIDEVADEIDAALKDIRGLAAHQKRLAFCLSAGAIEILEKYLKKEGVLRTGIKLNHQWFKKSKINVKEILAEKATISLGSLGGLDMILDAVYKIESKRNELIYGKQVSEEELRELLNQYLKIKKEVEKNGI